MSSSRSNLVNKIVDFAKDQDITAYYDDPFIRFLKKLGFKYLGSGLTRTVYGNGDFVVKIDFDGSRYGNQREYDTWNELEAPYKYMVAPILKYVKLNSTQSLLFMVQCKSVDLQDVYRGLDKAPTSDKFNRQAFVIYDMFDDIFSGNFMKFKNNIVAIDIGKGSKTVNKKLFNRWAKYVDIKKYVKKYKKELAC